MLKLTQRQQKILNFIRKSNKATNQEIKNHLGNVSRVTVVRELNILLENKLIEQKGKGRNVFYQEKISQNFLKYIDLDKYFQKESDKRTVKYRNFNFDIISGMREILSEEEIFNLQELNNRYRKRIKDLPDDILKKEFERLTIELSWKSSKIEGNTYSLIDTEILIKERKEAVGHKKEEAVMILNHKKTLDYIADKRSAFKTVSLSKIENIHRLIVEGLNINFGLRKHPVRIIGTQYLPIDNQYQVEEAMQKMVKALGKFKDPFSKALFAVVMISYIQPFADGNKRTARLLGNAILMANNVCPLSFRSVDEVEYKKSLIVFYEQNNIRAFKELFIEQLRFAVDNYFVNFK